MFLIVVLLKLINKSENRYHLLEVPHLIVRFYVRHWRYQSDSWKYSHFQKQLALKFR